MSNTGEVVSMRCLRHKRRFNVHRSWLETSRYLCPHCYTVLAEQDRLRYLPKGGIPPEIRPVEEGIPFMASPRTDLKGMGDTKVLRHEAMPLSPKETKKSQDKGSRGHIKIQQRPLGRASDNPVFQGLLPRYRIQCRKCGKSIPCHYTWFDTSTVLCPECYSQMGNMAVALFNEKHKASKPEYDNALSPRVYKTAEHTRSGMELGMTDDDKLNLLASWTSARIRYASRKELKEAVEQGLVSKARMRIELRRREASDYYDMCPKPGMEWQPPTSFE